MLGKCTAAAEVADGFWRSYPFKDAWLDVDYILSLPHPAKLPSSV